MASLPQNHEGNLTNENRKYWLLREILPTEAKRCGFGPYFIFHNEEWRYWLHLTDYSLTTSVFSSSGFSDRFNVRVGILGETGENIVTKNARACSSGQFDKYNLILKSQLDWMLKSNERFIFFVEIEKKDEEIVQKERKKKKEDEEKKEKAKVCKRKFQTDYKELLLSGKKSDLTINVKHRKFHCHTLILGARSPVFSAMMEHEMKEKRNGEVFMPDADPSVFQDFLLYLYTGNEEHLNWGNVAELYKLGDKYCVDDLKYRCVEQMKTNISIQNFFEIFLISQQHGEPELSESAIEFFLENSEDIVESKKWTVFLKECPDETNVLIKALVKHKS